MTTVSRPAATASRTASRLSTAGPAPARTACRTAVVVLSRSAGAAISLPGPRQPVSAACSACRVPDPSSRSTSGVAASSAGRTGDLRRAHG